MRKFIFFLVSFILVSCHSTKVEEPSTDIDESYRSTNKIVSEGNTPQLGFGYNVGVGGTDSYKCVSGYTFDLMKAQETVQFSENQSADAMRTLVSSSTGSSIDSGGLSLDADGMLERSHYDTENSNIFSFIYRYVSKHEVLMPFDLDDPESDTTFYYQVVPQTLTIRPVNLFIHGRLVVF